MKSKSYVYLGTLSNKLHYLFMLQETVSFQVGEEIPGLPLPHHDSNYKIHSNIHSDQNRKNEIKNFRQFLSKYDF